MKNKLLLAIAIAFSTTIFSQNLDFEEWTQDTILHLDDYMSTSSENSYIGSLTVIRSSDFTDGNYSLLLKTILSENNDTIFGYFANGDPEDFTGGQPVVLNEIDSVIGYYKYDIQPNDTALLLCMTKFNSTPTGGNVFTITGTQTTWKRFAYPISALAVDSVIIAAASSNAINNIGITPNSFIMFDNIQLKSNSNGLEPISNHSFEDWTEYIWEDLDEWTTINKYVIGMPTLPVTKTTDSHTGSFACSIKTQFLASENDTIEGYISSGQWTENGPIGGFPYNEEPTNIRFYYKNSISGIDTISVSIIFKNNGALISYHGTQITDNNLSYTLWEQDIDLSITPDTVFIAAHSGKNPGSQLIIDHFEFLIPVGITDTYKIDQIIAFPNPAKDALKFKFNSANKSNININIYSLNGKLLQTHNFTNITNNEFSVNISNLLKGSYIYKVNISNKVYSKVFIKE